MCVVVVDYEMSEGHPQCALYLFVFMYLQLFDVRAEQSYNGRNKGSMLPACGKGWERAHNLDMAAVEANFLVGFSESSVHKILVCSIVLHPSWEAVFTCMCVKGRWYAKRDDHVTSSLDNSALYTYRGEILIPSIAW